MRGVRIVCGVRPPSAQSTGCIRVGMRCRDAGDSVRTYAVNTITLNRGEDYMTDDRLAGQEYATLRRETLANRAHRDRQVELERRAVGSGVDEPQCTRSTEVWNQVGMLEEEIDRIGKSIDALCDSLEAAGVLEPPPPVDPADEEPATDTRLGKTLQDLRRVLRRYRECVCAATARLGV
jgi:hypothetical protein